MTTIPIQKAQKAEAEPLPIFEDVKQRVELAKQRAFELFEKRGSEFGHALDDWLKAQREVFGWPAAELKEKDGKYELQVTLPGFDPKEVQVTATPAEIIVHAATMHEKRTEEANLLWTEFGSNDVYRRFELPQPIDVNRTSAKLENGLLQIFAVQAAKTEATPVAIQAA